MQKLGGFSKSPPFLLFSFALSSALLPPSAPLLPRLHSLFPRPSTQAPPLRACTCALPRALAHTRTSADFCFLPSPFIALSQLTVYQHTRGEHFSTPSPSPSLHLPSRDSPQPATEKSHFFQHFPRISLATLPASPTAKSATEQVKVFSSKPSPLTL